MELVETTKAPSWRERLEAMAIGSTIPVSLKNARAAREAISRAIPNSGSTMKFETETKESTVKKKTVKYLEIKRTA